MPGIDWLILTAANATQARSYTAQLRSRQAAGLLDHVQQWRIVPDPSGRRVGSGGSTLWVLHQIAVELRQAIPGPKSFADLFAHQRILIIHSGGDSRRLCAYAAQGKVFTPLPCDVPSHASHPATLFDLILDRLTHLQPARAGQVLIASGDVLLTFDPAGCDFNRPGITGVAYPGPIERGTKHGVYVADRHGQVTDFLQKPDEATARERGAVDAVGRVLVDTGIVSLDPTAVDTWLRMAGSRCQKSNVSHGRGLLSDVIEGQCPPIDLYEQLLMAPPPRRDRDDYLAALAGARTGSWSKPANRKHLIRIHERLHGQAFHVNVLPWCEFFHIGTSRELLSNIAGLGRTAQEYRFANYSRSKVTDGATLEGAFVYNSIIEPTSVHAGEGVLIEASHITRHGSRKVQLAGPNILVGYPAQATGDLRLPAETGLVCLPIASQRQSPWAAVLFGLDDDFKTSMHDGGTLLNQPLGNVLDAWELKPQQLWPRLPEAQHTLWEARLWPSGPIDRVLELVLWMVKPGKADATLIKRWKQSKRLSMAQLMGSTRHDRMIEHRANLQRLGELHDLSRRLAEDAWVSAEQVMDLLRDQGDAAIAVAALERGLVKVSDPLAQARLLRLGHRIEAAYPDATRAVVKSHGALAKAASVCVARAVEREMVLPPQPRRAGILRDQVCWVTTPARLDFAGGWSDTPPICTELGGAVINAAVTLNGQYPIQVMAKLTDEPRIALSSIDLGRRVELHETSAVLDYNDPTHWAALPKAALVMSGLCPRDAGTPLKKWLEPLGGGIDLTLFSALPKGSGLGTSSILGSALLACLARIVAENVTRDQLIARTSLLEQMMTTGGGWQDQVGGIMPGIKLIQTRPGPDQTPSLHWAGLDLSPRGPLHGRVLLYYTGIQRMARDILQQVVGRYLERDTTTLGTIDALKQLAHRMKADLDQGDVDAFGRGLGTYWTLKKTIDPHATTAPIDRIMEAVSDDVLGQVLPGAGGGGFILMLAKSPDAARRVRQRLESKPPNPLARFFDFDIDNQGLNVTVL